MPIEIYVNLIHNSIKTVFLKGAIFLKKLIKSVGIISIILSVTYFINKFIFNIASQHIKSPTDSNKYYDWKFGKIYYESYGSGKPLLLLHSTLSGASSVEYSGMIQHLSKKYKVYVLDFIGYGISDKPKITYTAYLYVQLISDFIKEVIKDEHVNVITSGKSNAFATLACTQNPRLIDKLIFINPETINDLKKNPTKRNYFMKLLLEFPIIGSCIYIIMTRNRIIFKNFKLNYICRNTFITSKYHHIFYGNAHFGGTSNKYAFASEYCNYTNVNIEKSISQLNNSIYIIQGNKRDSDFEAINFDYKNCNASIETASIDHSKLLLHLEKPETTFELVDIFLND